MKNKRGFLLAEETLKIILGVIGIMFLAYLLFALYKSNSDAKDLEEAKASLARFFVETRKEEAAQVQIPNPKDWYMISWPNNGQNLESCTNIGWSSCLCICDDKYFKDNAEECNSAGACLENVQEFVINNPIVIDNPPILLNVNYETKEISRA